MSRIAIASAAIAVAAADASAQAVRTPLDVKACLQSARQIIGRLQPAAEAIVGKPMEIVPPTMVDIYSSARSHGGTSEDGVKYAARIDGSDIYVSKPFCQSDAAHRMAILAHELGHAVDKNAGSEPPVGSSDWFTDPREVSATRRAGEILRRAGIGVHDLVGALSAPHLEAAGILRPAAVPAAARKVAGDRSVALYQFDGMPGAWAFGRLDPLELGYVPTGTPLDEFFLLYFIIQRSGTPGPADPAQTASLAAQAYGQGGGDLAAVASAMQQFAHRRGLAPNPVMLGAIRRAIGAAPAHAIPRR